MKKGSSLLIVITIISVFLILAVFLTKIVYNNYSAVRNSVIREQAFYLAEAGIEKGKAELSHNPGWYTDLPYYLSDNDKWLIGYAVGQQENLGEGAYKIVREKGKNRLYSIGYKGEGIVVLKLTFTNPPFKNLEWSEL
ncbi:MAG: pilus assembly PilX N-terminal domain-containing protein [Candidatus Margulisiibacteriota bacterium]|nr:pilus assembly PilX N-terminal domain-containing protein [Candidatus Margulisiibacteriota bacterium]